MSHPLIDHLLNIPKNYLMYDQVKINFLDKNKEGKAAFFKRCAEKPGYLVAAFYWEPAENCLRDYGIYVNFRNLNDHMSVDGKLSEKGQIAKEVLLECARILSKPLTTKYLLEKHLGELHP